VRAESFPFLVAGAAVVMSASPATARQAELKPYVPTGSRIAQNPSEVNEELARKIRKKFAACVYNRNEDRSVRFLQSSDPSGAIDFQKLGWKGSAMSKRLSMSHCLGRAMTSSQSQLLMQIQESSLRNLLSEEAYLANHKVPFEISEGSDEMLPARLYIEAETLDKAKTIGAFSDCVVYRASAEADAILRTDPASEEEAVAAKALIPTLSVCLDEGQKLEFTIASIRSYAAEGLWSRSEYGGKKKAAGSWTSATSPEARMEKP
jgi:hypothetical protein